YAAQLEAGTFIVNLSITLVVIVEILQPAESSSVTINILEGWRLEQLGEYLPEAQIFAATAAAEAYRSMELTGDLTGLDVTRYAFLQDRPAGTSLEGYLFPDTYEIPAEGAIPLDVLTRQLDNFAAQVVPLYEQAVLSGTTDMGLHTVLTVASI